MAIPRVFVSSTWYDLKYIRENLRYFIKTLGYEPVLSEEGGVFYDPAVHTHDGCLTEIPTCQLFLLIIGGRSGGRFHGGKDSITNHEYREAIKHKIPVFALVEGAVYNEHHVYAKNRANPEVDLSKIKFPAVDSTAIFDFIDEVRGSAINNALVPFRDFGDIESYLRQQWAGMMFEFLNTRNQQKRVAETLATLAEMNSRIEMLSKQILRSVGTEDAKLDAELYEEMLASESIRDLAYWQKRPNPVHVLMNDTFQECANALGMKVRIMEREGVSYDASGGMSKKKFEISSKSYQEVRRQLIKILRKFGMSPEQYIKAHPKLSAVSEPTILAAPTDGDS